MCYSTLAGVNNIGESRSNMAKTALVKTILLSTDTDVDNASWQFVFHSNTAADFSGITPVIGAVEAFTNTAGTGGAHPLAWYISDVMSRGVADTTIEVYDITTHLDGSPHGSPVAMSNYHLGIVGTTPRGLPEGVAATISFRADYGTDVEFGPHTRPRARDRNRVYVGPLTTDAIDYGQLGHQCVLKDAFITDCLAALFDLSGVHGSDWVLQVWSRVNAAVKLPTIGWMDNRPDYQRRRSDPRPGFKTSRSLESV